MVPRAVNSIGCQEHEMIEGTDFSLPDGDTELEPASGSPHDLGSQTPSPVIVIEYRNRGLASRLMPPALILFAALVISSYQRKTPVWPIAPTQPRQVQVAATTRRRSQRARRRPRRAWGRAAIRQSSAPNQGARRPPRQAPPSLRPPSRPERASRLPSIWTRPTSSPSARRPEIPSWNNPTLRLAW